MFERLYPNLYLDSAYDIDIEFLKNKGIKGLILDIDNTLVPMFQKESDERTAKWLKRLNDLQIKTCIVSNAKLKRVEKFCEGLDIPYVYKASKPLSRGFLVAMGKMGISKDSIAVVGDQIFTDILGGNRLDMFTILVKPINPNELITIRLKRILEKLILLNYKRKNGK